MIIPEKRAYGFDDIYILWPEKVSSNMNVALAMLQEEESKSRLHEIQSLCNTVDYSVEQVFTQKGMGNRKYLFRSGKVEEIKGFVEEHDLDLVVFENFLTSRQILSLEGEFQVPVIDRFDLILNVFELHAGSREAKLQIELARLKRKMPYLKMHLSRRVRSEHPGFGGSGEFIVHSTLTNIHRRIKSIEKRLNGFEKRTLMQRRRRRRLGRVVSLAGYTNVGKTSLLHALTGVKKPARDELFTTLGTKTGSYSYEGEKIMVNDTIGFIRGLPFQLIYAFRATLMDISSSDMVLIVHDSSLEDQELHRRKRICEETLLDIGAQAAKWIHVENKIDMGISRLDGAIQVSALTGNGIEALKKEIHMSLLDEQGTR